MITLPQYPEIMLTSWVDGLTKLNHSNLTSGVNGNLSSLTSAICRIIDSLGGPGGDPNYVSLTEGGYVQLSEAPSSGDVVYFGAEYDRVAWLRFSNRSFSVRNADGQNSSLLEISPSSFQVTQTSFSSGEEVVSVTILPYRPGQHTISFIDDLEHAISANNAYIAANYAPLKGNAPYLTVGAANNFTPPYDAETVSKQTAPFIAEGTATNNNTGKVDTGALAYIKAKLGNSVVVNQKVETTSYESGTINAGEYKEIGIAKVGGYHKLLIIGLADSANLTDLKWRVVGKDSSDNFKQVEKAIDSSLTFFIAELKDYDSSGIFIRLVNASESAVSYSDASCGVVDLTQWFGFNELIPSDLLTHPEHFTRYYNGSLEYNEGELVNAQGTTLLSKGRNVWDESNKTGYFNVDGVYVADESMNRICSKSTIMAIPCQTYYYYCGNASYPNAFVYFYDAEGNFIGEVTTVNGKFTTPSNCLSFNFSTTNGYGNVYNHDITISLYYPNEGGYDQYYEYVGNVGTVDTGSEVLRSCGSVCDEKKPDGTITRKVGIVDLGTLDWVKSTGYGIQEFYSFGIEDFVKKPSANNVKAEIMCTKYTANTRDSGLADMIAVGTTGELIITDQSDVTAAQFKASLDGVYLAYELATPTAETGTSFPANLPIEDFGYLMWAYASGAKQIPQGIELDYPADYRGFVDSLIREVSGDTTKIVNSLMSQSDFDDVMEGYGYCKESQIKANFAPLKGDAPYLTVGAANNFTPYGPETTSKQTAPFIIEGAATNNNTGKVDTGGVAYIKAKRGNSVVVNQKVSVVTRTNTVTDQDPFVQSNISHVVSAGHKVLVMGKYTPNANLNMVVNFFSDGHGNYRGESFNTENFAFIGTTDYDTTAIFNIVPQAGFVGSEDVTSESYVIDLTQWFGSNDLIPSDLLSHPEHFSRYYNGSLEYNEGELVNAQGQALVSRGRNVWDEKWGNYIWDEGANGVRVDNPQSVGCKGYIVAVPNATYYLYSGTAGNFYVLFYDADKNYLSYVFVGENTTFTTPANCRYITFYSYLSYGITYNNDITISIYYPNEGGYDQYYAYGGNVGVVVTGSETLRSCGSVHDEKKPSGTITRVLGEVDLSDLTWTYNSSGNGYWTAEYTDGYAYSGAETPIALSEKYVPGNYNDNILGAAGYVFYNNEKIYVNNGSSSIEPSGKLIFKLVTPEEENGTSFPANLPIEDFGYLMWAYASGAKQIPQGIEIDYPADYRGFVDSLIREVSGDTTKIVNALMSQSDFDEVMNGYGYYKETNVASDIETTANLYVTNKRAYKTGHVVTISISAANISGSEIAANATLFTLPSYLYSASYDMRFPSEAGTIVISNDGKLSCTGAIANNARVDIYISYAI